MAISDLEKPGDDDIIEKLLSDFKSKNLVIHKEEIIKKINECNNIAIQKLQKENN